MEELSSCKTIVACPFTSLFFSLSSFYHWLRNKPWADFHFVWNTGPIQGISSTRQKRREHNGISLLLLFLLCIYVSIVRLCCVATFSCTCNSMRFTQCICFETCIQRSKTLKNPIQSNPFIVIFARLGSTYYAVYTIHWTFIVTFPQISHVVLLIVFFCVLFYFCFIHVQFRFCCCCFFNRVVFG